MTDTLLHSVTATMRRLSVGRTTLYQLFNTQQLRPVKLGTKTLVPESELQRFVASLKEARHD